MKNIWRRDNFEECAAALGIAACRAEFARLILFGFVVCACFPTGKAAAAEYLPAGESLFAPLLADPRQIQTRISYYRFDGHDAADAALGGTFGLLSMDNGSWKNQFDVAGMAYSRIYVSGSVNRFETEDFFANLPWEMRHGDFSARLTLYHESSHLGDDYIRSTGNTGTRFSQNAFKAYASEDLYGGVWRLYGGDVQIIETVPGLARQILQWGTELKSRPLWRGPANSLTTYFACDLQSRQYNQWNINSYSVAGLKLDSLKSTRDLRLQMGYFAGHSPYGQFIMDREHYADISLIFDF